MWSGYRHVFEYYEKEDSKVPYRREAVQDYDIVVKKFEKAVDEGRIVKVYEKMGNTISHYGRPVFISGQAGDDVSHFEDMGVDKSTIIGRADVGTYYVKGIWKEIVPLKELSTWRKTLD